MCGIFGAVGTDIDIDKLGILCLLNKQRGTDSTGLWNGKMIYKSVEAADKFLFSAKRKGMWHADWIFMGHTRLATTGAVTKKNAHPLRTSKIVGIHNGTISNFYGLRERENVKYQVDSHIIFHLLEKYGLNGLGELNGYGAIAWVEKGQKGLWLASFRGELSYAQSGNALYFSSDETHLKTALGPVSYTKVKTGQALFIDKGLNIKEKTFTVPDYYASYLGSYGAHSRYDVGGCGRSRGYEEWWKESTNKDKKKQKDYKDEDTKPIALEGEVNETDHLGERLADEMENGLPLEDMPPDDFKEELYESVEGYGKCEGCGARTVVYEDFYTMTLHCTICLQQNEEYITNGDATVDLTR